MSRSAMVISLLLVLALSIVGVALLIAPTNATTTGDAGSLLRLDPSQVETIRVESIAGNEASVVTRTPAGGWTIHLESGGGASTEPWPAQPTAVRAMVRALCDLRDESAESASRFETIEPALGVEITVAGGETHRVSFDSSTLGGRRLIEVDGRRTGAIDDQIFRALTSPGPASWRVKSPLTSVGERTSRIALRAPGQGAGVDLARIEGRWFLRQPVQSRANDAAATELLGAVGSLTIERFLDRPGVLNPTQTGLSSPRLTVRVEEDQRAMNPDDGQIRTTTRTQTLAIGGPADLSGKLVYASINDGETLVVLNIEPIESVSLTGERYLSAVAAETIGPNIGALSVRIAGQPEARYERGIENWRLLDATGATLGDAPTAPITALLAALTETPATGLSTEPPETYRPIASITLYDFGGGPMETIEAGVLERGALVLRSGQVFRVYEEAETPSLLTGAGLR